MLASRSTAVTESPTIPGPVRPGDVRQQLIELLGRTDGLLGRKRVEDEGLELLLRAFEGRKGKKG